MTKKILAIILALLMIVPMLASCGDEEKSDRKDREEREENEDRDDADETGKGGGFLDGIFGGNKEPEQSELKETVPVQSENEETAPVQSGNMGQIPDEPQLDPESQEIMDYVDDLAANYDFSGQTFTWIGGGSQAPEFLEETGDIVNDALYFRQRDIEKKFSIVFNNHIPESMDGETDHPVVTEIRKDVMAGTGNYDAGYGTAPAICQPLLNNGVLTDVNDFEGIDLSREWWTKSLMDTYSIGGKLYFLNGDIVTSNYTDAHAILFNKNVAEEAGIYDIYSLVENGEWTFDKMFELAGNLSTNLSSVDEFRYATPNGIAVLYANGYPVTQLDSKGLPYVPQSLTQELDALSTKFSAVFGDKAQTVHTKGIIDQNIVENFEEEYGYEDSAAMFADGKVLFYFTATGTAIDLRYEEVEYGILPLPKGSTSQDNYVSYAEPWLAFNVFVPKTTKDATVTGVILEAMAALSRIYLRSAYYDTLLRGRSTYDNESREMLDIIFETKAYDLAGVLEDTHNGDFSRVLKAAVQESSDGIASRYTMQARFYNREIQSILKTILD